MKNAARTSVGILASSTLAIIALLTGHAQASVTDTFQLGISPNGTMVSRELNEFIPWIAINTLPEGSFLESFTINAKLEIAITDNWASDICVYVDSNPSNPGTAAILQIGGYDSPVLSEGGTMLYGRIDWANGQDGAGATVSDTKIAGVDFPAGIDLSTAQLSIGNGYAQAPTWSGTISVTYSSVPEPATAALGGLAFGLLALRRRRA